MRSRLLAVAALLVLLPAASAADPATFPLKDGDTWVMAGDSITAQHLHSNYFEAFCYARYPTMTFRFRNSGVGGDTIPKVLARYDWDVAVWGPTVVSVELGMNDQGGFTVEKYIANMGELDAKIRAGKARPVYFTASPMNNGNTSGNLGGNTKLNQYAVALKAFAAEKNAPFADQFHHLLDIWGKNKPREQLANTLAVIKVLAKDDSVAGVEYLRQFLEVQSKAKAPVSMMGDPVHPGPTGQLTMAAALLKDLGADGFVSSAVLDAKGDVIEAKGCKITAVKGDHLTFDRTDDCLPFPIPADARAVLPLFPTILDLSQYTLAVKGLSGGFTLAIDGVAVGIIDGADLEKGINLTAFDKGPIAAQGSQILAAVAAKEGLVGQARNLSRAASAPGASADAQANLDKMLKNVDDADTKIRAAAKPKTRRFEVVPAR
jgi:lysophospholipase L1-like esterase